LAFRAAAGLLVWFLVSCLGGVVLWLSLRPLASNPQLAFLVGFILPQIGVLKDRLIPYWVARRIKGPLQLIQEIDEFTRLYLKRIIAREERKINFEFFNVAPEERALREKAVDKLFEFHQIEIALERRKEGQRPDEILAAFRFQNRDVRFKMLLRFLGYQRTIPALESLALHPELLQTGSGEQTQEVTESSYVRAYVLGQGSR
jgi:hypothetical protein